MFLVIFLININPIQIYLGRIINVSSANGRLCVPGLPIYCASKHGLEGFSNTLRMELSPWNVIVILFNPG